MENLPRGSITFLEHPVQLTGKMTVLLGLTLFCLGFPLVTCVQALTGAICSGEEGGGGLRRVNANRPFVSTPVKMNTRNGVHGCSFIDGRNARDR